MPGRPDPSSGAALLVALWATAAMAAMGIAQATQLSQGLKWMGRLQEQDQSLFLCWTGMELSSRVLAEDGELAWDAPKELWGQVPEAPVIFEGGVIGYRISDEQGRVPLNSAPQEVLERLPGFTPQAATRLLALRAEGKTIAHLGEMRTVEEYQAEQLPQLEPVVSVHAAGATNLNTAPQEALLALGMSPALTQTILLYRKGPDGAEGTPDDAVFIDVERIVPDLEALAPLLPEDQILMGNLISSQQIGVRSSLFRVAVEGKSARHGVARRVTAVLDRGAPGDSPLVRGWHETD